MKLTRPAAIILMLTFCFGIQFSNAAHSELFLKCQDQRQIPSFFGFVRIYEDPIYGNSVLRGEFSDNYLVGFAVCNKLNLKPNKKLHCSGLYGAGDPFQSTLEKIDEQLYRLHLQGSRSYRGGKMMKSIECRIKR